MIGYGCGPRPLPSLIRTLMKLNTSSVPTHQPSKLVLFVKSDTIFTGSNCICRSLHHSGEASASGEVNSAGDPSTNVGVAGSVGGAAGSGLGAYGHSSQDYGRPGRDVYHTQQPLMASPLTSSMAPEGQGRPSSTQTQLYNPAAAHPTTSQYESNASQAVEGSFAFDRSRRPKKA